MLARWTDSLYELIVRASSDLPEDVQAVLEHACAGEEPGSNARRALETILENASRARRTQRPLCQDTGALLCWVQAPAGSHRSPFQSAFEEAVRRATADGVLRQNSVDSVSGCNSGTNLGPGSPVVHWREGTESVWRVSLVLKGGGCENVGRQYSLPNSELGAGRDLEGVRRCILDAVNRAQGKGCAPGVLGVAIGGDRATGYAESKRQLLRKIGQRSTSDELAELEKRVLQEANELGIGPMGFGGRTTLLDVFVGALNRLPASYFVSISYMCWAFRRKQMVANVEGEVLEWR